MRFKRFQDDQGTVLSVNMEYVTAFYVNHQDATMIDLLFASAADPASGTMATVKYDYEHLCAEMGAT